MIEVRRRPTRARMAVIAIVAGGQVNQILALGGNAVMAGNTGADCLRMIDGKHRHPYVRVVTILTHIARLYVRERFALCLHAVVAAYTIAGNIQVVEVCR